MASILITDDSIAMRQMVTFTLKEAQHNVVAAEDGAEALALAKQQAYDLVITDINMPNLDGVGLVKALRTLPSYQFTPILMLTTETDPTKKQAAKSAGATGWINKPFDPDKLLAAIRRLLG